MRLSVPGPRVLLLTLVGACANDPASPKADEASPAPEDSGEPPAPDDSGEPPAPDCGRGTPSEGLSAEAAHGGDAFSGDLWTCSVRNLVDPIGDGVTIAYDLRSDSEIEVVEETADGITVVVPYPEEVSDNPHWGLFRRPGCRFTVTDSAGCSVEVYDERSGGAWFDPRTEADITLDVRTDSSTGERIRYISASWRSDPPTGPWAPPVFDWYRNGELVASVDYPFVLMDFEAGDEIRTTIRWVREDGLELRGEASITVSAD